ncbi:DNA modification methylase [Microvirga lupini]|uniref:site-specific DNA-methyltransferase (adenine-specific) n=1 Tax=Microvirga lupini TaxID=420324 RepID=A0A7W4VJ03_9HYPH|nr:site-specific DNA-methyltransferase [Microvirga lupini]MBB3017655.1 DNA modification methylase [Microvirga lupini]
MSDLSKMMGLDPDVPQIKLRPLDSLVAYARNSRTHSPAQVEQLQALLLEYGWTNSVLIDDMGIVAGHGRCMAAEAIYKRGEQIKFPNGTPIPIGMVPTMDVTGWSAQQRRAYIIADNRSALSAGWDDEMLKLELAELKEADFDLSLTAFDEDELAALLAPEIELPEDKDPDAAPAAPDEPVSVPGDVWVMGAHRLCVGDATSVDAWDRLLGTEQVDIVWTDPPYNVDQGRKNREQDKWDGGNRADTGAIANDKMSPAEFSEFLQTTFATLFGVMKPGAPIYVAHSDLEGQTFRNAFADAGLHLQSCLVWKKDRMVLGRMDWQSIHEPILYGWKKGSAHRWYGGRKNTSVIDLGDGSPFTRMEDGRYQVRIGESVLVVSADAMVEQHPSSMLFEPKPASSGLHPTQKPVALVERMLKQSARAGDLVADAFGGSGSTLIAADRLGMSARLMELSPKFADVIVRRWEHYSGRKAVHAVTGEEFPGEGEARALPPQVDDLDDEALF